MPQDEMFEMEQTFAGWPVERQLLFVERLLRRMRRDSFTDRAAVEREMEAMANDPGMQRVLNNQDLGPTHAAG
jgi:hypothetical protein